MLCLRTILVAEMVNTFREVSTNAVLQVEANRMWLLPTLETSVILSSQFSPVSFKRNKEDVSKEPSLQLPDTMNLSEIFLQELFIGFHIVGRQPGFSFYYGDFFSLHIHDNDYKIVAVVPHLLILFTDHPHCFCILFP